MTKKIAQSNLLSIQDHLDKKKFDSGKTIIIAGLKKKVIKNVDKMYKYLHKSSINPKSSHSYACKILRTLSHAEKNRSLFRSAANQEFYESLVSSYKKVFHVDLKGSIRSIKSFISQHYPEIKKAPFTVKQINKILDHANYNIHTPLIVWRDLKKILDISYKQKKSIFNNEKEKIFYNKMCESIVLKKNLNAPTTEQSRKQHQFNKDCQEIKSNFKKSRSRFFSERESNVVEINYEYKNTKPK